MFSPLGTLGSRLPLSSCLSVLGGSLAALLAVGTADAAPLTVETNQVPAEWVVQHQGRTVVRYTFTPGQYKPYVKELCTVEGRNLLRDAPSDHRHHHGLMYAIRLNQINFWEEVPGSGVQKPVGNVSSSPVTGEGGRSLVSLVQTLHWLAPEHAFLPDTLDKALLIERRTLTVAVDEPRREVSLHWRSEFEVGRSTPEVTLGGANYFGLGARFHADLDAKAQHLTGNGPLDLSGNRQDVSCHPWAAVVWNAADAPATFAILGHPRNRGGAPWFFSMKTPFAYLSATEHLDQEPRTLLAGERFTLEYLVIAVATASTAETLQARYQRWAP
jgi:hypothetical protein